MFIHWERIHVSAQQHTWAWFGPLEDRYGPGAGGPLVPGKREISQRRFHLFKRSRRFKAQLRFSVNGAAKGRDGSFFTLGKFEQGGSQHWYTPMMSLPVYGVYGSACNADIGPYLPFRNWREPAASALERDISARCMLHTDDRFVAFRHKP